MAVVGGGCCAWVFGACLGTPGAGTRATRRWGCGLASRNGAGAGGGGRTSVPGCRVRWGRRRTSGGWGGLCSGGVGGGIRGRRSRGRGGRALGGVGWR